MAEPLEPNELARIRDNAEHELASWSDPEEDVRTLLAEVDRLAAELAEARRQSHERLVREARVRQKLAAAHSEIARLERQRDLRAALGTAGQPEEKS